MRLYFKPQPGRAFQVWERGPGGDRFLGTVYQTWMLSWKPDAQLRVWLDTFPHARTLWPGEEAAKLNLQELQKQEQ